MTKAKNGISSWGTVGTFISGRACSDTLFHVISRAFDRPQKLEEKATVPFAGGILQHGYQCGMIWGATLAAGSEAYRRHGSGPRAQTAAVMAAQRIVESFRSRNGHINCVEITNLDKSSSKMQMIVYFLIKGGTIGCFRRAGGYAPLAFDEITAAFAEEHADAPGPPVSCAALLAEKMGATEMHTVMAAGLAGGIGLCGGACGALGAAIWLMSINCLEEDAGANLWNSKAFRPRVDEMIERFLKSADFNIECAEIVGRKFEDVGDHACYLREGGCLERIEELATYK